MSDFSALPQWRCHKVVRAAKISGVFPDGLLELNVSDPRTGLCMCVAVLERDAHKRPAEGDYVVVYDDGYVSWSPAKAFEEGYSPLVAPPPGWRRDNRC